MLLSNSLNNDVSEARTDICEDLLPSTCPADKQRVPGRHQIITRKEDKRGKQDCHILLPKSKERK